MGHRFVGSLLAFAERRMATVYALVLLAAAVGVVLVSRVSFDANVLRLLPRDSPAVHDLELFLEAFGSLDHLYVTFDAEDAVAEHADLVDAYLAELRRAPEIDSIDAQLFEPGKDWGYLADRQTYLLGARDARRALARLRPPGLDEEMIHARDLLSMPSQGVKALVQQDPLGLLTMLRDRMGREKGLVAFDPVTGGYVSPDGHSRLVIVKPRGAPFDTDFCKALFLRLTSVEIAARRSSAAADPDAGSVRIETAGAYRMSLEAERLIRREAIVNSTGSLIVLLLVMFTLFRTPWMMVYGSIPIALAAVLTLGINGFARRSLSPATSGSAGMLFGLGIDGVVLLYLRYLEERSAGWTTGEATRRLVPTASSVVLAQLTTAATFFALLFIDFPTLEDLGGLVGLGILLSCGFTLLLLPALIARTSASEGPALSAPWLGAFVTRARAPIVWTGLLLTIALAGACSRLRLDTGLERLQAHTRGAEVEERIADRFGLPRDVWIVLNRGDRIEPLLEVDARLERELMTRAPSIAASGAGVVLPPLRTQEAVARLLEESGLTAAQVQRDVRDAAQRAGFRSNTFDPFLGRVPTLLDPRTRITYDGLVAHGLDSVVSRFIVRRGSQYLAVTYLYPRQPVDAAALKAILVDVDPRLRLTGFPAVDGELAARSLPQFVKGVAIGTLVVALLIYVAFRSIRHTLLALLPTAVGFIWSAGLLALFRVELDLFSLFAAVTFIGIAVDYGIYVLYRYEVEGGRDMREVLTRTGAAIAVACGTALIGFGSLMFSSYGPLRVFGIVSIVTLTCCLVASIVLLPAIVLQIERWSSPPAR